VPSAVVVRQREWRPPRAPNRTAYTSARTVRTEYDEPSRGPKDSRVGGSIPSLAISMLG
jgi:hypothetical protein